MFTRCVHVVFTEVLTAFTAFSRSLRSCPRSSCLSQKSCCYFEVQGLLSLTITCSDVSYAYLPSEVLSNVCDAASELPAAVPAHDLWVCADVLADGLDVRPDGTFTPWSGLALLVL